MAKGVYRMVDGRVVVEYGRHRALLSRAQYKANGYLPPYDKLGGEPTQAAKRRSAPPASLHGERQLATREVTPAKFTRIATAGETKTLADRWIS